MTIEQTIEIPKSRKIIIKVPPQIPAGQVKLTFTPITDSVKECTVCEKYRDQKTGELRFNAETIAAFKEGDAIIRGEIPAQRFNSLEELLTDLRS